MRVAMITGSYPPQPCGVGDYTERIVRELRAAGVDIDVFATQAEGGRARDGVFKEVPDWRLGTWRRESRSLLSRTYDVVHLQYPARYYGFRPDLAFLSLIVRARLPEVPIVVTLHEFRITHPLRKLSSAAITVPAARVFLTAESEKTVFLRWLPWMGEKVRIVRLGPTIAVVPVTPERRLQVRAMYGVEEGAGLIVYFGLLHPNKGIEALLSSFAQVHAERPSARLLMLSFFEPDRIRYHAELKKRTTELGIVEAVIWAGFLPPIAVSEALGSADIAFLPFQDGVSFRRLSFLTAMLHRLPVVTTVGLAGRGELQLIDGMNAVLLPADAPPGEFTRRLRLLLDSPRLREAMGEAAGVWAEPFQWGTIIAETLKAYQEVIRR